jgi:molybdopterin synthase catalytic subunit
MKYRNFEILNSLKKTNEFENELNEFENKQSGAMVTFIGRVRDFNNNKKVTSLSYQAYDDMAQKVGEEILQKAKDKFDILDIKAYHRSGDLEVTHNAVKIYAIATHRKSAFLACEYCIDEIKKALPVWKKESYENESSQWVFCKEHKH